MAFPVVPIAADAHIAATVRRSLPFFAGSDPSMHLKMNYAFGRGGAPIDVPIKATVTAGIEGDFRGPGEDRRAPPRGSDGTRSFAPGLCRRSEWRPKLEA